MSKINFRDIGYDYGIKPIWMVLGDIEFSELFIKANCNGVVYIFYKDDKGEKIPVQMAFIFENEKPANKLLDILLGWVERSNNDGDAVGIDFIEKNDGGYAIAIFPEMEKLLERTIPKYLRDKVVPLIMVVTHYKTMDSLGENYLNFKANHKKRGKISIGYAIGNQYKILKQSDKYFIKTEFNFYKENNIPPDSMAAGYKLSDKTPTQSNHLSPKKQSKKEISQRRIQEIKSLMPLTLNKLKNQWLATIQDKLKTTHAPEIIYQAICNLIVFERMKLLDKSEADSEKQDCSINILTYLLDNFESFDSYCPPDEFFTEELIVKQILNDQKVLKDYLIK